MRSVQNTSPLTPTQRISLDYFGSYFGAYSRVAKKFGLPIAKVRDAVLGGRAIAGVLGELHAEMEAFDHPDADTAAYIADRRARYDATLRKITFHQQLIRLPKADIDDMCLRLSSVQIGDLPPCAVPVTHLQPFLSNPWPQGESPFEMSARYSGVLAAVARRLGAPKAFVLNIAMGRSGNPSVSGWIRAEMQAADAALSTGRAA